MREEEQMPRAKPRAKPKTVVVVGVLDALGRAPAQRSGAGRGPSPIRPFFKPLASHSVELGLPLAWLLLALRDRRDWADASPERRFNLGVGGSNPCVMAVAFQARIPI